MQITPQTRQPKRTHRCQELNSKHIGQEVCLAGWVNSRRDHGGVIFIDLRDITGLVQVVINPQSAGTSHQTAENVRTEYVVQVLGKVLARSKETINQDMRTGEIEVIVSKLSILNSSSNLPFPISDSQSVGEQTRLKYRYLDLRHPKMQNNLLLRSKAMQATRKYLSERNFIEIETPVLNKSTPEGARDYLVPSRINKGSFYALPQSPQIFKQLLMVSGMDRYFQIVKCFRDEDLRGNRQPEFTQIDIELSFTEPEEIYSIMEGMILHLFQETINTQINTPFERMTYEYAMENYGVDAPDLRYDMRLISLTDIAKNCDFQVFRNAADHGGIVKMLCVKNGANFSRKQLDQFTDLTKIYRAKGMAWVKIDDNNAWNSPIAKFFTQEQRDQILNRAEAQAGDLLLFGADTPQIVHDALGNLRKEIAWQKKLYDHKDYRFVWITDFPLVEYDETEKRYSSVHHPFTAPYQQDLNEFSETEPAKIRSQSYDLVLNGVEIGGGSIRIHQKDIQKKVFNLLHISPEQADEKFGFLLEALEYGAPPHGGIAFGLDRIIMFLVGTESIRDVIAFPKTQQAACLMTDAPSTIDTQQMKDLGLSLKTSVVISSE